MLDEGETPGNAGRFDTAADAEGSCKKSAVATAPMMSEQDGSTPSRLVPLRPPAAASGPIVSTECLHSFAYAPNQLTDDHLAGASNRTARQGRTDMALDQSDATLPYDLVFCVADSLLDDYLFFKDPETCQLLAQQLSPVRTDLNGSLESSQLY